jgi:CubicO group peptidase (beta-lactamase class C family)
MKRAYRVAMSLGLLAIAILAAGGLLAQAPKEVAAQQKDAKTASHAAPAASGPAAREMTSADLEAFLDGMMPAQLEREDIAGAAIAVVKDGQVIFAKGYGYSDFSKRTPVTPDATLFRPGSISKLFTWTSIMQLVEQGKLDLDRDVNDYLDFKIPPAFGKPITL